MDFYKKTFKHIEYYEIDIYHVTVLKKKDVWKFIFLYCISLFLLILIYVCNFSSFFWWIIMLNIPL